MKKIRILFLVVSVLWGLAPNGQAAQPRLFERRLQKNITQTYFVQTPQGYNPDQKYPLLIAVHSEKETSRDAVDQWGPLADRENYILICPSFSLGFETLQNKEDLWLMHVLLELRSDFPYDQDKVYLVGFSGGGECVHRMAFKRSNIVQAVCVFAAAEYDIPPTLMRNRQVKFFVGVGEKDNFVKDNRVSKSQKFYNLLKVTGYDVTFKIYPETGQSLTEAMREDAMMFFNTIRKSQ
ncbi:MAG TPA: dienelactone hydrolase family protein [Candidatus Omnitrophota bacterium]|jgi:predicted peptidase|nr:dienelactone hydrolase family protein [Candidatus Omnitrophota bacterium]HPN55340.1 dienelactone hydrolase family protein [Candidatus Omnitrophota bacterium]